MTLKKAGNYVIIATFSFNGNYTATGYDNGFVQIYHNANKSTVQSALKMVSNQPSSITLSDICTSTSDDDYLIQFSVFNNGAAARSISVRAVAIKFTQFEAQ